LILQTTTFLDFAWIFGIGLMFGLAFLLNYFLDGNIKTFFVLLLFFAGFVVSAGMLDYWVIVLLLIVNVILIFIEIRQNRGIG